jgi:hypothetical protein
LARVFDVFACEPMLVLVRKQYSAISTAPTTP